MIGGERTIIQNQNEEYKETELGLLPKDWEVVRLGDEKFFHILESGIDSFSGKKYYLATSSIEGLKLIGIEQEITFNNRPSRANMQPVLNSVWFARMVDTRKVYAFSEDNIEEINGYILSTGFCGIKTSPEVDTAFLKFYFYSDIFNNLKNSLCTGAVQVSLNNTNAKKLLVPLPSLSEQKRIAFALSTVQKAIERTEDVIKATKEFKKSMMKHLFTYGPVPVEEAKHVPLKETEIGLVPKDWEVVRLGDVAELKGRIGWRGYTFEDLTDEGPITLGATNISDENKIDLSNTTHITYKKFNESPEIKVCVFDIILVQRGSIGKVTIIDRNIGDATINPSIILIKKIKISPQFLYNVLTSHKVQSQIESILSQTGVPMISQSQARRLMLLIPKSKPEQHRIASILSQIDETIEKEQRYKEKLERIKQGLMDDLLTGKVRVNHLIKEGVENVSQA